MDEIDGLGKKRRDTLLSAYGSLSEIKDATIEELSQYVPHSVAIKIKEKFDSTEN